MALTNFARVTRKAGLLFSLLPNHPREFHDRVSTFLDVNWERLWLQPPAYTASGWQEVISGMERSLGTTVQRFQDESALAEIQREVTRRIQSLSASPFALIHNADFTLAQLCYLTCRILRPAAVLETGVAHGVTSAFILKALEANDAGCLHSIDLPPLGANADEFVGILVPQDLRKRWHLHRGSSRRTLPGLLHDLGRVDVFVHDSLHTYGNMAWEFRTVAPYLGRPGVVLADDVENNAAFLEWVNQTGPAFWATLQEIEKKDLFGVSVFL